MWDVVIIGSGPAGLAAGLYLSRSRYETVVLEKDNFGGPIINWECIENYPGFANGVPGATLAAEMISQASKFGLQMVQAEVIGIDNYSSTRWVRSAGGEGFAAKIVIIAGGAHSKKLGVPGESELQGKGVFNCALCDGEPFKDKVVAVCGGGDSGISEALYMTRIASKVILLEAMPALNASAVLQERARSNPKLEIRTGTCVEKVNGRNKVESIELVSAGGKETLPVDGLLVRIGLEPNTGFLSDIPLDKQGKIIVNERMETQVPFILAAGDIRSGSPNQVITAAGDGAIAAITAQKLLQQL